VPFAWRHDRDLSGMNIMLMGAWYECLMRWIGPASSVLAITRTHVKERKDPAGSRRVVTIPDHVEVIAEMYSGPTLHMRVSEVTGLGPSDIWIFGCNGTARIDMTTSKIYGGKRGTTAVAELPIDEKKAYKWRAEEEFINAIRGKEPILMNTFETGLLYMEFAEAVTRSAQTGCSGRHPHLSLARHPLPSREVRMGQEQPQPSPYGQGPVGLSLKGEEEQPSIRRQHPLCPDGASRHLSLRERYRDGRGTRQNSPRST